MYESVNTRSNFFKEIDSNMPPVDMIEIYFFLFARKNRNSKQSLRSDYDPDLGAGYGSV